ncbi:unnamed protein product, partial [Adineta ricciae]
INLQQNPFQFHSFSNVDKFALKSSSLALYSHDKLQVNVYKNSSEKQCQTIKLDNQCEHLCFNATGEYLFVLIKPRILSMYRTKDNRQMAKLFVYDFVTSMNADEEFVVLAMKDRRLLTLMIADPHDSTLHNRIQQLPSRNIESTNQSDVNKLVEYLNKCADFGSSDEEKDDEESDWKERSIAPISSFRFVTRLIGRCSHSKMKNDEEIRSKIISIFENTEETIDLTQVENDSDDDDVVSTHIEPQQATVNTNLDDIRQKTSEYDQNQIKGVQFANAGSANLKVINNHSVTSETCVIV